MLRCWRSVRCGGLHGGGGAVAAVAASCGAAVRTQAMLHQLVRLNGAAEAVQVCVRLAARVAEARRGTQGARRAIERETLADAQVRSRRVAIAAASEPVAPCDQGILHRLRGAEALKQVRPRHGRGTAAR